MKSARKREARRRRTLERCQPENLSNSAQKGPPVDVLMVLYKLLIKSAFSRISRETIIFISKLSRNEGL
jgi:hypothetical protein